ncbi:MAG TPA: flagellar hook-length control protein FliK [Sedimenticola thiotaurini]|uniref:Flagellar hook-length control protein FliK n=1 Tax=Sedimenticola thiotaurini TaxID=1543721 RepID=A0A831W623_9GAMM|nr:flagellar hook-length control protein FliK [Sedimenticola thiotaurini]
MTNPSNGTGGAGIMPLLQTPSAQSAPANGAPVTAQGAEFTEIIDQALALAGTGTTGTGTTGEAVLAGLVSTAAGQAEMGGKLLPPTAEFAAENSDDLEEGEAIELFGMLGLTLAGPAQEVIDRNGLPVQAAPPEGDPGVGAQTPLQTVLRDLLRERPVDGRTAPPADPRPNPMAGGAVPGDGQPLPAPMPVAAESQPLSPSFQAGVAEAPDAPLLDEGGRQQFGHVLSGAASQPPPQRPGAAQMAPPPLEVATGEPGWERGVGERILWMAGKSLQAASIQLNPRHLGPIEIQLSLQHDQASVSFSAQHAVVRDALEAAIPRLREMFADNNLQLVNVDVGQQRDGSGAAVAQQFQGRNPGGGEGGQPQDGGGRAPDTGTDVVLPSATALGLLDDYA